MPRLYIGNKNYSSWSLRPWVLMRQLDIGFDERLVPFGTAEWATELMPVSPSGKVPCLVDDEFIVWDSLAIAEYLAESHPTVWPTDRTARAWARSASAEMHSGFGALRGTCAMSCGMRIRLHAWPERVLADWRRIDALWCDGLARFGGPFLAGAAFTAVDAFFTPVAFRAQTYSPPLSDDAGAYVDRLLALPAMREWYEAALAEVWREEAHEAEFRAFGEVLSDLRTAG